MSTPFLIIFQEKSKTSRKTLPRTQLSAQSRGLRALTFGRTASRAVQLPQNMQQLAQCIFPPLRFCQNCAASFKPCSFTCRKASRAGSLHVPEAFTCRKARQGSPSGSIITGATDLRPRPKALLRKHCPESRRRSLKPEGKPLPGALITAFQHAHPAHRIGLPIHITDQDHRFSAPRVAASALAKENVRLGGGEVSVKRLD